MQFKTNEITKQNSLKNTKQLNDQSHVTENHKLIKMLVAKLN